MLPWLILLTIGAYLLGSVPTSYIAGRLLRGVDIRDYGSRTVSSSNVFHSVARWAVVPVGIFDILKGLAPVALACYVLQFDIWAQGVVGLAAIAGHNWSIFLGFSGGRGLSAMMGVLFILAPWELAIFIAIWVLGIVVLRNSPIGAIIGAIALPLASLVLREPVELTLFLVAVLLLLVMKRLLADRAIPSKGWRRVAIYRLVLDRDISDREAWIHGSSTHSEKPPENG